MSSNHKTMRSQVDAFIENVSSTNVSHFYLETISSYTSLPIDEIVDYVFKLVEWEELDLKYELRCPEYGCNDKIRYDDYNEIPFDSYVEDCRGHEIYVEKDIVVPLFQIPENLKAIGINFEKKSLITLSKMR